MSFVVFTLTAPPDFSTIRSSSASEVEQRRPILSGSSAASDVYKSARRLWPGPYAGGSVSLDLNAARKAIAHDVATPLGLSETEAAAGIIRILEQNLLHAVERISIQRGYNPGRFMLIACGGAGPMHGASVGRRLGARAVSVPLALIHI